MSNSKPIEDNFVIEFISDINAAVWATVRNAASKAPAPIKAALHVMEHSGNAFQVTIAQGTENESRETVEFLGNIVGGAVCSYSGIGVAVSTLCSKAGGATGELLYDYFTEAKEQAAQNPQLARDMGIDIEGIIEEVKQESPVVRQQIEEIQNHTTDPDMVPDPGNHGGDGDDWNDDAADDMGDPNWDPSAEDFSWDGVPDTEDSGSDSGGDSGGKPVLIDLEGDGIKLIALDESNTYFDFDNDGLVEKTAWTEDAILMFDENGDGVITNARDIAFSQYTDAEDTDLEALATTFDSNGDGVLDAHDADFGQFNLWLDDNANGLVDLGELQSLAEAGIASIGLTSDHNQQTQADGSVIFGESIYTSIDGSTGAVADVAFRYSNTDYLPLESQKIDLSGFEDLVVDQSLLPQQTNSAETEVIRLEAEEVTYYDGAPIGILDSYQAANDAMFVVDEQVVV